LLHYNVVTLELEILLHFNLAIHGVAIAVF